MSEVPGNNNGLIQMPDFIKDQPQQPAGYDGFASSSNDPNRFVPVDQEQLSPFAKIKAEGSPYRLDAAGRAVPVEREDIEPRERGSDESTQDTLGKLIESDIKNGFAFEISSRKDSNVIYKMMPTGKIAEGLVHIAGVRTSDGVVANRWITEAEYLAKRAESEAAKRAQAEHVGEGVIAAVETAVDAGAEEQGLSQKPEANTILKDKIDKVVAGITFSIENAGHFDPASACGQSAEEIKKILRNGVSDEPTVAILRQAINVLEQGSESGRMRNDSRATVAALSNARTVLRAL